jgi:transketolase
VNHVIPKEINSWIEEFNVEKPASAAAAAPAVPKEKIQVGVSKAMIAKRDAGFPVVSIASDLASSTGTKDFHTKHPDVSFDIGIAEANMVSAAAGFSKSGYIPFVDTFAQFGVTKGALPLTMASLSESPIIAIFSHIGFQDAADGASHQALTYLSMTASIPHVDVYSLTCSEEAEAIVGKTIENFAALKKAGKHPNSTVFFLGRENFPRNYGAKSYDLGKAQILFDNSDKFAKSVCLVGHGSLVPEALKAAELLAADGIGSVVVNPSIINRPDIATFKAALAKTKGNLITVEEHQKIAGFGSILCHALQEVGVTIHARTLAVEEKFGQSAYTAKELYQKHGLDAAHIVKAAKSL